MNNIYYFIDKFDKNEILSLDKKINIIYRNYEEKRIEKIIRELAIYCKLLGRKLYLSNNIKIAQRYNLDGLYIPSFNKNLNHLSFSLKKNFALIGSAHNLKEIRLKEIQKVEKIFISSLFKKNKNYLGINRYKLLSKLSKKKIVVLGGISRSNVKKLKLINYQNFAGISYFE